MEICINYYLGALSRPYWINLDMDVNRGLVVT